jgi:hypothetical protein
MGFLYHCTYHIGIGVLVSNFVARLVNQRDSCNNANHDVKYTQPRTADTLEQLGSNSVLVMGVYPHYHISYKSFPVSFSQD